MCRLILCIVLLLPSSAMTSVLLYASGPRTDCAIGQDGCPDLLTGNPLRTLQEVADDVTFLQFGRALSAEVVYSTWPAGRRLIVADLYVYASTGPGISIYGGVAERCPSVLLTTSRIEVHTPEDEVETTEPETDWWVTLVFPLDLPVEAGALRFFSVRLVSVDPMPSGIGPFLAAPPADRAHLQTIWTLAVGDGRIWRADHYDQLGTIAIRVYGVPEPSAAAYGLGLMTCLLLRRRR